jgi:ppGpp synthetase/RelA/SpoT-type nucleotidyltranferase
MEPKQPKTILEYKKWLRREHKILFSTKLETRYEYITNKIKRDFEQSDLWQYLTKNLGEFDNRYYIDTGYSLFIPGLEPEIVIKPFDSFFLKTFRKNILENTEWPNEPEGGWILPENWHSRISDSVRTFFVVKYLDGVEYIVDMIQSFCSEKDYPCCTTFEAREEGYYAVHLDVLREYEIPRPDWDTERIDIPIEIQITTQLQEVIRKLLHKYYEKRRKEAKEEEPKWQWDYQSEEFSANYLGHILHYIEGVIMDIRERQRRDQ